ncbi:MAG: glycosyltransferase [Gammaproteobacteria bacterium]|nr:glycosyltransferase [Gammaproteobacteria bacterium]
MIQFVNQSIYLLFGICFIIIVLSLINRVYILWLYNKASAIKEPVPKARYIDFPKVTVQLPIFNEMAVVQRLINNICKLDYPSDKLEIQVLDDSTDETKEIAQALCDQKRALGFNICHIHRENREGYKAGALQNGLQIANGEFIAIFDSDFLPEPDFLKKTIHYFTEDNIGWVQTRWAHLNENFSLLTQCIALVCDSLFRVENSSRSKLNHWGIFNGTAGVIRRSMIEQAGGWNWDTITEDSDLSYRALTMGWSYVTLADTTCPCELPPTVSSFIEQQIRWAKGNIQVVKKLSGKILATGAKISNKYDYISHLTSYFFCPAISIFSLLIMPHLLLNSPASLEKVSAATFVWGVVQGLITMSFGAIILFTFFKLGQRGQNKTNKYILFRTLIFMFMSIGLAPFISVAIFEGFFKKDREFVRTPKYDLTDDSKLAIKKVISSKRVRRTARVSVLMGIYVLTSVFICLFHNCNATLLFLPALIIFGTSYFYFGFLLAFPGQRIIKNIYEYRFPTKDKLESSLLV